MIAVTTDEIEGVQITSVAGLVRGSTVHASHIGRDIMAGLHNMVGGEIEEYTGCWQRPGSRPSAA